MREIPQPPARLYFRGPDLSPNARAVSVVGARRHSAYGQKACEKIVSDLAPYPVTIISGLAVGIDTIAHETALRSGLTTVAVLGSGLADSALYPAANRPLALRILEHNGSLISELEPNDRGSKRTFPARNRIMAGLSDLVIAIECGVRSGTRITARLATEYNRDVGAVPHDIFSEAGSGTNALLRLGAHVIRNGSDVAELLGLTDPDISRP